MLATHGSPLFAAMSSANRRRRSSEVSPALAVHDFESAPTPSSHSHSATEDDDEFVLDEAAASRHAARSALARSVRVEELARTFSSARVAASSGLTRNGSVLAQVYLRSARAECSELTPTRGSARDSPRAASTRLLSRTAGPAILSAPASPRVGSSPGASEILSHTVGAALFRRAPSAAAAAAASDRRRSRAVGAAATSPHQRAGVEHSLERYELHRQLHDATQRLAQIESQRADAVRVIGRLRVALAAASDAAEDAAGDAVGDAARDAAGSVAASAARGGARERASGAACAPWPGDARFAVLKRAIVIFNRSAKRGVRFLLERGFLSGAKDVAHFLRWSEGLSRSAIGEYIAGAGDFAMRVADFFFAPVESAWREGAAAGGGRSTGTPPRGAARGASALPPRVLPLDEALRAFLRGWTLPGEAGPIDRLMQRFAAAYFRTSREAGAGDGARRAARFATEDVVFVCAFALIMLNTDLHNQNIHAREKMKLGEFKRTLAGINDGEDLNASTLAAFYRRVKGEPFEVPAPPRLALRVYPAAEAMLSKANHAHERHSQRRCVLFLFFFSLFLFSFSLFSSFPLLCVAPFCLFRYSMPAFVQVAPCLTLPRSLAPPQVLRAERWRSRILRKGAAEKRRERANAARRDPPRRVHGGVVP